MAAAALESLAVLHASHTVGMRYAPRAAPPPVPAAVGRWTAGAVKEFKGLAMTNYPSNTVSTVSLGSGRVYRKATVLCKAQNATVDVPDVTKTTWKSLVMESDIPVLVEFWAPWCGPCRMILPVIAKLSKTYEDKIKCFKLNTDESPDVATQYGIRSIPTILIFKNGEKKDAVIGAVPESTLITCIEKYV